MRDLSLDEVAATSGYARWQLKALRRERDGLREALDNLLSACELPGEHCEIERAIPRARAALEGEP